MASASRAVNEMGAHLEAVEAERDELRQDLDLLLGALQPFLVDLGVGAGTEELEHIREVAQELERKREERS